MYLNLLHVELITYRFEQRSVDQMRRLLCQMHIMTSSNGNIFRVTGPLCGEFTGHRWIPSTKASDAEPWSRGLDVSFDLRQNKRLNKQSWGWWFETPLHSLWRHRNEVSRAGTSNYSPQKLWNVITCPYPWYLLLTQHSRDLVRPRCDTTNYNTMSHTAW